MPAPSTLSVADILGPNGSIAKRIAHYEERPQQLAMAEAMGKAAPASGGAGPSQGQGKSGEPQE